jgi:hypothetical protein
MIKVTCIYYGESTRRELLEAVASVGKQGYSHIIHVGEDWVVLTNTEVEEDYFTEEDIQVAVTAEIEGWYDEEGSYVFTLTRGIDVEVVA